MSEDLLKKAMDMPEKHSQVSRVRQHAAVVFTLMDKGYTYQGVADFLTENTGHVFKRSDVYSFLRAEGSTSKSVFMLLESIRQGDEEKAAELLEANDYEDEALRSAVREASVHNQLQILTKLERFTDLNTDNSVSLCWAAAKGYTDMASYLLERGADINANDGEPFRSAAFNTQLEMMEFLVDHGADIHGKGDEALSTAIYLGNESVIGFCLEHTPELKELSKYPLLACCEAGNTQLLKRLLDAGMKADSEALCAAVAGAQIDAIEILLANNTDIHADNDAALNDAVISHNPEIAELLLSKGADRTKITEDAQGILQNLI